VVGPASVLAFAALLASSAHAADACALRARIKESSAALRNDADAASGRARACLNVVTAVALVREGRALEAAAMLRAAGRELPEIAADLEARAVLLEQPAPDVPVAPTTPDAAAARILKLVAEAKPKEAATLALSFPRSAGVQHDPLEVATVTALVRAERTEEAFAYAVKLTPTEPAQKVRAWALSKAHRYTEAGDAYGKLKDVTQDPALKAEASFHWAFAAYEQNDHAKMRERFAAALPNVKDSGFEAASRWYLALGFILDGQHAQAIPVLDELTALLPSDKEVRKHRYWRARSLVASGKDVQGRAALEALAREDATDWYGLLARARLGNKPLKGKKVAPDAILKRARKDASAARPRLLFALGLDDDARKAARIDKPALEDIGLSQSLEDWWFGYRRGPGFLPFPRAKGDGLVGGAGWRASYAAPWHAEAVSAAAAAGIAPSFLFAIVRTESGFDPRAVSIAGALGATQLLPSVARGACRLSGRPEGDAERIFEPAVSLALGATMLGLHQRELGSIMFAAAAYNGAPQNVAHWMKEYGHLEVELFVERIPFRETRDYVKKVLATEALYRGLDGGEVTLALPEQIPAPPARLTLIAPDR
jgi:soluble lytic murein transglycosylase